MTGIANKNLFLRHSNVLSQFLVSSPTNDICHVLNMRVLMTPFPTPSPPPTHHRQTVEVLFTTIFATIFNNLFRLHGCLFMFSLILFLLVKTNPCPFQKFLIDLLSSFFFHLSLILFTLFTYRRRTNLF